MCCQGRVALLITRMNGFRLANVSFLARTAPFCRNDSPLHDKAAFPVAAFSVSADDFALQGCNNNCTEHIDDCRKMTITTVDVAFASRDMPSREVPGPGRNSRCSLISIFEYASPPKRTVHVRCRESIWQPGSALRLWVGSLLLSRAASAFC